MKKSKQQKSQDTVQTNYMRILGSLKDKITSEYGKAIGTEYQGVVLGYD